jgi:tripartite-type tricarboxylate transporter receptor subunit TctC
MVMIINTPDFKKRMAEVGAEPIGNSPTEMAKQIKDDTEKYAKLVIE